MYKLLNQGIRLLVFASSYRCLLRYSTSETGNPLYKSQFVVDYLINLVGFSREEAICASAKVTQFKSTRKPDSVLNFFIQSGLDKTNIKDIVSFEPKLLLSDAEKTLKPKVSFFQELGLSGSDLVKVITANPFVFSRGLHTYIMPCINYLRTVLKNDEKVVRALKKTSWLLSCPSSGRMKSNILFLQKCGISDKRIEKLILRNSRIFAQKPKWLEEAAVTVEEKIGIPR